MFSVHKINSNDIFQQQSRKQVFVRKSASGAVVTNKVWTDDEVQRLKVLKARGMAHDQIGKLLHRSAGSVGHKWHYISNNIDGDLKQGDWTNEDVQRLRDLKARGMRYADIGKELRRSAAAVSGKWYLLNRKKLERIHLYPLSPLHELCAILFVTLSTGQQMPRIA